MLTQPADTDLCNIADGKIGMQRCGCLILPVSFQLDLTGVSQADAGDQCELVRPQLAGFRTVTQGECEKYTFFIFIMSRELPLHNTGKTVGRRLHRAEPRPADRDPAADGHTRGKCTVFTEP